MEEATMKRLGVLVLAVMLFMGCKKDDVIPKDNQLEEVNTTVTDIPLDNEVEKQTIKPTRERFQTLSTEYFNQMKDGNFDQIYEAFGTSIKEQMTKENLVKAWNDTIAKIGTFQSIQEMDSETVSTDVANDISVIAHYEASGLRVRFIYDDAERITGLWFSYEPLPIVVTSSDMFEEIEISLGEAPYQLPGILTLPKGVDQPSVAILVHGSGSHDQDSTIGKNKPFRDLAHGLAKQGIASIRYQETGAIYPQLAVENYTIEMDSLDDAKKAIDYAVNSEILSDEIIVIGHSLGGLLAPSIAKANEAVKKIVIMAGSPRNLEDIILDQNELLLGSMGIYTEEQIKATLKPIKDMVDQIKNLTAKNEGIYLGIPASYWVSLKQLGYRQALQESTIPTLILQGEDDLQISYEKDYQVYYELLKDQSNVTFQSYEGLNHIFMPSHPDDITFVYKDGTVANVVIDDISTWIKEK